MFLLFAALIWVISALSEKYTAVVPVHVEIENDATAVILLEKQLHVDASMSASGFSILYRRLFPPKPNIRDIFFDWRPFGSTVSNESL